MNSFCALIRDLQGAGGEAAQIRILQGYLLALPAAQADTVRDLLSGRKVHKLWTRPKLKACFVESGVLPEWLLDRCQKAGADVAETLARCWPTEGPGLGMDIAGFVRDRLPELTAAPEVRVCWDTCRTPERIVVNRLLLGQAPIRLPPSCFSRTEADLSLEEDTPVQEVAVELMYACFPDFCFGQEVDGDLQLFTRVRVENPAHLRVLLDFIEKNTLEKKGPVQIVKRGLCGRIGYREKISSPRHKSGFKVEGANLLTLYPPGEFWGLGNQGIGVDSDTP